MKVWGTTVSEEIPHGEYERESQGGVTGSSKESGVLGVRRSYLKNPITARETPTSSNYYRLQGGKTRSRLHSTLKPTPNGKKYECSSPGIITLSCEICRGLRVDIHALYFGNDRMNCAALP